MFVLSKVLRRSRRLPIGASNVVYAKLEIPLEERSSVLESPAAIYDKCQAFPSFYQVSSNFSTSQRSLSSNAGAKNVGEEEEEELEDGYSDLDNAKPAKESSGDSDIEDELTSEGELSEDENDVEGTQDELDVPDADGRERRAKRKKLANSKLFKVIITAPGLSVASALDKWVEDGKEITRDEVTNAMFNLRKRRMYGRALQMSEWLEANKKIEFTERDYASRLDLIAKLRGLSKAEAYIERIPKSFRGEVIYRTLLANCAATSNVKKTEEVFNKMKDLGLPVTSFAIDQMLLLYKRTDKKKIPDVLLLMEKEEVKPSLLTYKILIDAKGSANDITGMEQVVEAMKADGLEPDLHIHSIIARHYAAAGLKAKAEKVIKEMEGESLEVNRRACKDVLSLYASLGKTEEVNRIWKICEENPRFDECLAAVLAFGKLKKIKEAEAIFEKMLNTSSRIPSKTYSVLLRVYVDHKMLTKGKELVKRMADSGCRVGALTWDALVKLYVDAGEVEKADSMLNKATQQNQMKPLLNSFMTIMDEYAKRGDVHNTEKILLRMRQAGYVSRLRQFQALIQAYINGKVPPYGMRDRMKADNIFPNKAMAGLLAQADPFKKTAVSELLD